MGIIENNEAILGNNRSILGEILNRIIGRKNRIIGTALCCNAEEVRQGQQGQLNMIVNCIIGSSGLHS